MCEASMHVPHRKANETERLEVRSILGLPHMRGLYPQDMTGDTRLVCIKKETEAWIEKIELTNEVSALPPFAKKWNGKTNVVVTVIRHPYHDIVKLPDGNNLHIVNLKVGTRINIGVPVPVTGDPGMSVVEKAIDEVGKTAEIVEQKGVRRVRAPKAKA